MWALGVLGSGGAATARGGAKDNGERGLPAEHVMDFRHLVDDLIHGRKRKRHHARTDNGAKTTASRTDTGAYIGFFRDRADPHPLLAKFRNKTRQRAQTSAQMEHGGVAPHLLAKGL